VEGQKGEEERGRVEKGGREGEEGSKDGEEGIGERGERKGDWERQ